MSNLLPSKRRPPSCSLFFAIGRSAGLRVEKLNSSGRRQASLVSASSVVEPTERVAQLRNLLATDRAAYVQFKSN